MRLIRHIIQKSGKSRPEQMICFLHLWILFRHLQSRWLVITCLWKVIFSRMYSVQHLPSHIWSMQFRFSRLMYCLWEGLISIAIILVFQVSLQDVLWHFSRRHLYLPVILLCLCNKKQERTCYKINCSDGFAAFFRWIALFH